MEEEIMKEEEEKPTRFIRSFTLEDMCLRTIIKYLDIIVNNKNIPPRCTDFLLRLYSEECFRGYVNYCNKTEEGLLWFLNPYNKKIFLPDTTITQNIMKRLQTVGPIITSLTLRKTDVAVNEINAVISLVPHLSYLDLSHTKCSDETLNCIQRTCSDLVTLNVEGCDVTDDGMLILCGSNLSLKNLNILCSEVEYGGLYDILEGMPSLQCLTYDNMAESLSFILGDDLQDCIRKNIKYNLTELIYEDSLFIENPARVIITWMLLCPKVEKIHILFPVNCHVLKLCTKFPLLKELKLRMKTSYSDIHIPDSLAPFLNIACNLSTLILCNINRIPSVTLIECFKNVEVLHLKNVTFTAFNEEDVKSKDTKLGTLCIKKVDLDTTSNTYKFIALLMSLSKNVTKLILSHLVHVPDELVDIILNSMKNLTYVEFNSVRKDLPHSICRFFEIPSVQEVHLDNCNFSKPTHVAHEANTLSWCAMDVRRDDVDYDSDLYEPDSEDDIDDYYFGDDHYFYDADFLSLYGY